MSLVVVPTVGSYLIKDPLLSVFVIGGGVAFTGFMVYAEMCWLLRNMHEQVLAVEAGEYDLTLSHDRVDRIGHIFDTFQAVAGDLGRSLSEAEAAQKRAEKEAEKARTAEKESARRKERLRDSVETMPEKIDRFADGDLAVCLDPTEGGRSEAGRSSSCLRASTGQSRASGRSCRT